MTMYPADGQYALGVDSRKGGMGRLFTSVEPSLFPHAFCKIYIDKRSGNAACDSSLTKCQHGDGVGSKSVQRYLHWVETGDASVFEGDADDCFVMNAGDVSCAGLFQDWVFTDNISINQLYVKKNEFVAAIAKRLGGIKSMYASHELHFTFAGGETADLPDQVKTYVLDGTLSAYAPTSEVVTCENIVPGDIVMGIMSGGPCKLEMKLNSGLMSNGATLARHVLFKPEYAARHPEITDPRGDKYTGRFGIGDHPTGLGMEVSQAVMSPTRHFPIMIYSLLSEFGGDIHGMTMNTGGGATKCTRVGHGLRIIKDNMPEPDPLFRLIQEESGRPCGKMLESFNMGVGVDVMVPASLENHVKKLLADKFGVGCEVIGHCERSLKGDKNHLLITGRYGDFEYDAE